MALLSEHAAPQRYVIHASQLFDSRAGEFLENRSVSINGATGAIESVTERASTDIPDDATDTEGTLHIDARGQTILPGFVDSHTHIFLHAYAEASSIQQERDESLVERIVRATQHCRAALKAGYTTYRDLGTEGADGTDSSLRDAVARGLTPGPRLYVATEPLASSGSYAIRYESRLNGTTVPSLSDAADGVDGVTAAVRRRIGAGADLVKFYADYRRRGLRFPPPAYPGGPDLQFPPKAPFRSPNYPLFNQDEMNAIVGEARRARVPVAAHASEPEAVMMAARAGVTSIEHGFVPSTDAVECLRENNTIFVPTLCVLEVFRKEIEKGLFGGITWEQLLKHTRDMWNSGVRIAAGGDTGAFRHGDNVREIELLIQAGLPVNEALRAATIRGWEACGGVLSSDSNDKQVEDASEAVVGYKFGCLEPGWRADLVGLNGDPSRDLGALRRVGWVVKDGRFVVRNGRVLENGE